MSETVLGCVKLGNCDIHVKRKISVINEMKQDEILFKTERTEKVFIENCKLSTFVYFSGHER